MKVIVSCSSLIINDIAWVRGAAGLTLLACRLVYREPTEQVKKDRNELNQQEA